MHAKSEVAGSGKNDQVVSPATKKLLFGKLANGKKIVIKEVTHVGLMSPPTAATVAEQRNKSETLHTLAAPTSFKGINYQRIRQRKCLNKQLTHFSFIVVAPPDPKPRDEP